MKQQNNIITVTCPTCNNIVYHEIPNENPHNFKDGEKFSVICDHCDKNFEAVTHITFEADMGRQKIYFIRSHMYGVKLATLSKKHHNNAMKALGIDPSRKSHNVSIFELEVPEGYRINKTVTLRVSDNGDVRILGHHEYANIEPMTYDDRYLLE